MADMPAQCPRRISQIVVALLASLAGAIAAFLVIAVIVIELRAAWARIAHPHDRSVGDTAGWALVFLAPVLAPLDLFASVAVGVLLYAKIAAVNQAIP